MPISKWINWDQQSFRDNLWELADEAESERKGHDRQRRFNEAFIRRSRDRRLHVSGMSTSRVYGHAHK